VIRKSEDTDTGSPCQDKDTSKVISFGEFYRIEDPRVNSLYKKVACVFNHRTFYANIQDVESAFHVDFNLENEFLWRNLSMERISSLKSSQTTLSLLAPSLNVYEEEDTIERDLKNYLANFRKGKLRFSF
jgi:centrosomal protein CEP76